MFSLLEKVSQNGTTLANYVYLSDGTKVLATDAAGNGLIYAGSYIFKKTGSSLYLESGLFSAGRLEQGTAEGVVFASYEPHYFLRDHLGSVRVVVNQDGEVLERNDYYPMGMRWIGGQLSDNLYRYNGKEEQGFVNLPYNDYGARMGDPRRGGWLTSDPLLENHPEHGPYVFCGDNPIRFVDMNGMDYRTSPDADAARAAFEAFRAGGMPETADWDSMSDAEILEILRLAQEPTPSVDGEVADDTAFILENGMVVGNMPARGEIRPYAPNLFGRIEMVANKNFLGRMLFGKFDDLWIALQSFIYTDPTHLNGNIARPKEKLAAGVNSMSGLLFNNFSKYLKIPVKPVNAVQFNKLNRGTGINAATGNGVMIRQYNYIIRNTNEFNNMYPWVDFSGFLVGGYNQKR